MRKAEVRVPASAANIGAGYDCIGIAVDRWLTASVRALDAADDARATKSILIRRSGLLAGLDAAPRHDLLHIGFAAACAARGHALPRQLEFDVTSEIPVARGLGSSSAALIAGASLANTIFALGFDRTELAMMCSAIEGHPDNVAPAIFGGAVLGAPLAPGRWSFAELPVHTDLAFIFAVPEFPIMTAEARAVLPAKLPHAVAVAAAAKSAALVHGLATANAELLSAALDDVLHVPFRKRLIAGYDDVAAAACAVGAFGVTLSGSGSTLMAIAPRGAAERVCDAMRAAWMTRGVESDAFVAGVVSSGVL
ncbi:MAG: homoserine kinase [Gemmatimonadota bacterium]|nr:homoserine kinase [Gemmatimonadota bacterium]